MVRVWPPKNSGSAFAMRTFLCETRVSVLAMRLPSARPRLRDLANSKPCHTYGSAEHSALRRKGGLR
jgi:hypothetical protein